MPPDSVELFHEILIWPLELEFHPKGNWIEDVKKSITKTKVWSDLDSYDRQTTKDADLQFAEFVYFHPFIQKVLYPLKGDPNPAIAILKRDDIKKVEVGLQDVDGVITLNVERVHLYLFRTQIAMLVVEVSAIGSMELDTALQLMDQFRAAYAPYFAGGTAGHCPVSVEWLTELGASIPGSDQANYHDSEAMRQPAQLPEKGQQRRPPVSRHWAWLLNPMQYGQGDPGACRWRQLEDHRIPTMTFLAVHDPFSITPGDMVRICFCDEKGNRKDFPYAPGFLSNFDEKYCYDRYWNPPPPPKPNQSKQEILLAHKYEWRHTRYLCCGYNFATVTSSSNDFLLGHFRHHYFQLGLLAHFHRASLLKYSRRLTDAASSVENGSGSGSPSQWENLSGVRREFADFVNQYWFREASGHEQGKELFRFWSARLGNQELLEQLGTESTAVDSILRGEYDKNLEQYEKEQQGRITRLQESTDRLTRFLYWLTGLALIVAFLDMDIMRTWFANVAEWWGGEPQTLVRHAEWSRQRLGSVVTAALAFLGLFWVYWARIRRPTSAERRRRHASH